MSVVTVNMFGCLNGPELHARVRHLTGQSMAPYRLQLLDHVDLNVAADIIEADLDNVRIIGHYQTLHGLEFDPSDLPSHPVDLKFQSTINRAAYCTLRNVSPETYKQTIQTIEQGPWFLIGEYPS